jgi:hypothetical protein
MSKTREIKRASIGYLGIRAKAEWRKLRYTVEGRGHFPTDMLRYDEAELLSPVEAEGNQRRQVRIVNAGAVTPDRWWSFGWSVHDDIEEYTT